jgi:hypothetical protein
LPTRPTGCPEKRGESRASRLCGERTRRSVTKSAVQTVVCEIWAGRHPAAPLALPCRGKRARRCSSESSACFLAMSAFGIFCRCTLIRSLVTQSYHGPSGLEWTLIHSDVHHVVGKRVGVPRDEERRRRRRRCTCSSRRIDRVLTHTRTGPVPSPVPPLRAGLQGGSGEILEKHVSAAVAHASRIGWAM